MKTRIVYPQMWLDEKFAKCKIETKLLFCYLITSEHLNLTPFHHISDRQILFDTGLNSSQLDTGKEELSEMKWCFFTENWVYHNHICSYVNYTGRDIVMKAKEEELKNIPLEVIHIFNPLITRYKVVINHKSETINNKPTEKKYVETGKNTLKII
jgi:hypothetical protein